MNYYFLETLARDRHSELLRDSEMRRLVAAGRRRPADKRVSAPRFGVLVVIANAVRTLLVPVRKSRIEHPGLGDVS
jgi:hypothetical protein